jgi:hypothetical protein
MLNYQIFLPLYLLTSNQGLRLELFPTVPNFILQKYLRAFFTELILVVQVKRQKPSFNITWSLNEDFPQNIRITEKNQIISALNFLLKFLWQKRYMPDFSS